MDAWNQPTQGAAISQLFQARKWISRHVRKLAIRAIPIFGVALIAAGSGGQEEGTQALDPTNYSESTYTLSTYSPSLMINRSHGILAASLTLPLKASSVGIREAYSTVGDLPDAPNPQSSSEVRPPQTKRILGIIPNFRAVSTDEILPPQSIKEKFLTTTQDSFDYSSVIIPVALAGYSVARNSTPEFGQGAAAYGRYFWHAAVDQTSENYLVEFVLPVLTHEDSRYYTLGKGGLLKRTGYALSRAVVTRSDSAKNVLNISEIAGAAASAALSNLYYPAQERTANNTSTEWGLDIGIDAITFVLKEFWPDINHSLFHLGDP